MLVPGVAQATGGGPLLLIVNGLAFLYGSVLIILVESAIYWSIAGLPIKDAFRDSLMVTLYSTVVVGIGVPIVIALVGGAGSFLSGTTGQFFSAMGTWVYEGNEFLNLTFAFTGFWLLVTFYMTVRFEAAVLAKRWNARALQAPMSAGAISWRANSITYAGLAAFLLLSFIVSK